jgi:ATP-binding cassette subfamily B protein
MNTDTANDYVNEISETFSFRRANKILAANQYVLSRIHNFHALHVSAALKSHLLRISISHLYYPCALAATVVAVGAVYDKVSISNLSVFLWSFVRAAPVLTKILQSNVTMLNFFPSYVQVQTISENARLKREISGDRVFTQLDTPITLQNISFGFKGEKPILTDINMEIVPGKITALIGLSGSGKSTIIDLLLRLKNPLSGKILVNGVSLGEYDVESWRCAIGYVSQEPKVRNMTIRENLTFGLRRSVSDGIDHSLQKSNSLDVIASKEKGLETAVGGQNGDLSGGEKQRLNLAKAVLSSPSLLILDEATNQQDLESTSKIKASLTNLKSDMAIFLVAHQSDVLDVADIIYRLDNGKIIKQKS